MGARRTDARVRLVRVRRPPDVPAGRGGEGQGLDPFDRPGTEGRRRPARVGRHVREVHAARLTGQRDRERNAAAQPVRRVRPVGGAAEDRQPGADVADARDPGHDPRPHVPGAGVPAARVRGEGGRVPGPHVVGGHAEVDVSAAYFAGGALPDAEVAWSVSQTPGSYTPPNRQDYTFGTWVPWWEIHNPWEASSPARVDAYAARTDASGRHELRIDFLDVDPPRPTAVKAEATVTDVNRQGWTAAASLLVHPSELYVGLKSERLFVQRGGTLKVDAIVTGIDGAAVVGRAFTVRAERLDWEQVRGRVQGGRGGRAGLRGDVGEGRRALRVRREGGRRLARHRDRRGRPPAAEPEPAAALGRRREDAALAHGRAGEGHAHPRQEGVPRGRDRGGAGAGALHAGRGDPHAPPLGPRPPRALHDEGELAHAARADRGGLDARRAAPGRPGRVGAAPARRRHARSEARAAARVRGGLDRPVGAAVPADARAVGDAARGRAGAGRRDGARPVPEGRGGPADRERRCRGRRGGRGGAGAHRVSPAGSAGGVLREASAGGLRPSPAGERRAGAAGGSAPDAGRGNGWRSRAAASGERSHAAPLAREGTTGRSRGHAGFLRRRGIRERGESGGADQPAHRLRGARALRRQRRDRRAGTRAGAGQAARQPDALPRDGRRGGRHQPLRPGRVHARRAPAADGAPVGAALPELRRPLRAAGRDPEPDGRGHDGGRRRARHERGDHGGRAAA